MSDTILSLARAKSILRLQDSDAMRDQLISDTLLPAVDDIVEQHVGWVVPRVRTFTIDARQRGQEVVLPGGRVLDVQAATDASGNNVDVTGVTVDAAGIVQPGPAGHLPAGQWELTVRIGMDPIPRALVMAAGELLVTAWENYRASDPKPFVVSYRAAAWLAPFTNGATIA